MDREQARIQRYLGLSPFNQIGGDSSHNACVGVNGGYNQLTIYEGFKAAVYAQLKSVANPENALGPMIPDFIQHPTQHRTVFERALSQPPLFTVHKEQREAV